MSFSFSNAFFCLIFVLHSFENESSSQVTYYSIKLTFKTSLVSFHFKKARNEKEKKRKDTFKNNLFGWRKFLNSEKGKKKEN